MTDLDQKALEAAANAYAAATMDLPHHDCENCGGSGAVITGRGETAGGDTCATCGGGGVVVDFPEGWNPMASAITAYLAALPSPPALDGAGREGLDRDEQLGITQYLLMQADIEVPDDDWPGCVDLCDNRVCGAVGCLVSKYRRVRALKETR